jgi:tight adherence protein C
MRSIGDAARTQRRTLRLQVRRSSEATTISGFTKACVERLQLLSSKEAATGRKLLVRAGIRTDIALSSFLFLRVSLPAVFGAAILIDGYVIPIIHIAPHLIGVMAALATVAGFYAPIIALKNRIAKRQAELRKSLPDGIDLLVICVESGASINEAFARVGRELARGHAALAEEFTITAAELAFLPVRRIALENLLERTGLPAVRGIVTTMIQSERFGTPIAHALRVLSGEFREARMMAAEEKAAKLPVLLTLPMMVFILPVLFVVLLGPAALTILDAMAKQ